MWVKFTGNQDLAYVPIEKLHDLKYLCGDHFTSKDFNRNKTRLKRWAVPSQNLRTEPLTDELLEGFPLHLMKDDEKENICPDIAHVNVNQDIGVPDPEDTDVAAVHIYGSTLGNVENDHDYCRYPKFLDQPEITQRDLNIIMDHEILQDKDFNIAEEVVVQEQSYDCCIEEEETVPNRLHTIPRSRKLTIKKYPVKSSEKKLFKKLLENKMSIKELHAQVKVIESSPALQVIIGAAIRNIKRKPQGRRYTIAEKGLALSIYKKSPKVYRLFNQLNISLPSERTLQTTLHKLNLEPGLHETVVNNLKKTVESMTEEDKICAILFDEMTLKKRLIYNPSSDKVEGFVDLGEEETRRNTLANKVLVVMLQGLRRKYKQPVAHFFVETAITKEQLAVALKNIIQSVTKAGFIVKASVCDQGSNNMGAVNLLKAWSNSKTDDNYFDVDGQKVFIVYDVPHLFKNIRNNLTNGGTLTWDGKTAKMQHLYDAEQKNNKTLHFKKINKIILRPSFKGKMKVKYAAHLLSNTVQAVVRLMGDAEEAGSIKQRQLHQTADVVQDMDFLFDATNGPSGPKDIKRQYRENVRKNDFHHKSWIQLKDKLRTAYFSRANGSKLNVRCLSGYITSISSLQDLWHFLSAKGFKVMNLRQLNQDSLENLFGQIRQHSPTNPNPTCHHFTAALKSCIMTKICTPSRGSNCEPDQSELLLDFTTDPTETDPQHIDCDIVEDHHIMEDTYEEIRDVPLLHLPDDQSTETEQPPDLTQFDMQPTVYVSGFLAKKILAKSHCNGCISEMTNQNHEHSMYKYISYKEWWTEDHLTYPSEQLCQTVSKLVKVFETLVKPFLHRYHICKYSMTMMLSAIGNFMNCEKHKHDISIELVRLLSLLLIRDTCKQINEEVSLGEEKSADILKKAQMSSTAK